MSFKVRNKLDLVTDYKPETYSGYLEGLGFAAATATEISESLPEVVRKIGRKEVTGGTLEKLGRRFVGLDLRRVELSFAVETVVDEEEPLAFDAATDEKVKQPEYKGFKYSPRSVFEFPLLGMQAQAELIRDVNPGLARFMQAFMSFCRATAEEACRTYFEALSGELVKAGMTTESADEIQSQMFAHHIPVSPRELLEELETALSIITENGDFRPDKPVESLTSVVMVDTNAAQYGTTIAPDNRFWSAETPVEKVPKTFVPEWFYYRGFVNPPAAVAVASVEDTRRASGTTYAATIMEPATSTDDDIRATDITYLNRPKQVFNHDNLGFVAATTPVVPEPSYDVPPRREIMPQDWTENLMVGFNSFVYAFNLTEKNLFPYADKLNKLIKDNNEKIEEEIDELAEKAGEAAGGYLQTTPLAPLAGLGEQVVEQVAKQGMKFVYDKIKDAFGDVVFPPVRIIHTVNYNPPALPCSLFIIMVGDNLDSKMYAIEVTDIDPSTPTREAKLIATPDGDPNYPIGNGKNRRMQEFSRQMIGYSRLPGKIVPHNLWKLVGEKKTIAEWASSANQEGFRVVVSIPARNGAGNYVWALRADVLPVNDQGELITLF